MISGNDSDFIAGGAENIKFVGKMGDMMVYHDFAAVGQSIVVAHKTFVPGDASVILIPTHEPTSHIRTDADDGQPRFHYRVKYAYSRNPLDESTVNDSVFVRSIAVSHLLLITSIYDCMTSHICF
jgi:hypothetical protein